MRGPGFGLGFGFGFGFGFGLGFGLGLGLGLGLTWSSTRESLCWQVKAVPSISRRMRVVAAMIDGLLQNHQTP